LYVILLGGYGEGLQHDPTIAFELEYANDRSTKHNKGLEEFRIRSATIYCTFLGRRENPRWNNPWPKNVEDNEQKGREQQVKHTE
jgi:hypothetical protein